MMKYEKGNGGRITERAYEGQKDKRKGGNEDILKET